MNYFKLGSAFVLLLVLNWFLTIMPFDGYLGKLVCLVLLVMIASNNTFLGIVGVAVILRKHGLSLENMTSQMSETELAANKADFRKNHCKKGKIMNDGEEISMDDLASAFPDLDFTGEKCNPCSKSCDFILTSGDEKLSDEEKLRPKNSKESFVSR